MLLNENSIPTCFFKKIKKKDFLLYKQVQILMRKQQAGKGRTQESSSISGVSLHSYFQSNSVALRAVICTQPLTSSFTNPVTPLALSFF